MPRTKISEFSATAASNTDIDSINLAEGCAPSGINDAIRELMSQLKDFQTGAVGDSFNGPVGSTTAAAGAFTTLTASSTLGVTGVATLGAGAILNTPASVTLTNATGLPLTTGTTGTLATTKGGTNLTSFTANGVVYASSSSALATGSALVFDGTTFGVTGALSATGTSTLAAINASGNVTSTGTVGIANNSGYLMKDSAGNYRTMSILNGSNIMSFGDTDNFGASEVRLVAGTGNPLKLYGGNTLVATLTSTSLYTASGIDVGIGTSSPVSKLDVRAASATMGNYQTIQAFSTDATAINLGGGISLGGNYSGSSTFAQFASIAGRKENATDGNYAGYLQFGTNSQATGVREVMRLDSSGNLGLGVTPSAWNSSYKAFQSQAGAIASVGAGEAAYLHNAFIAASGNYTYVNTAAAARYSQAGGVHYWFNAASGTAGNAITFTQAMTLDASGNLIVGGTSALVSASGRGNITINGSSASILSFGSAGTNTGYLFATTDGMELASIGSTYVRFTTNGSERARIDSSGNFVVGSTSFNAGIVGFGAAPNGDVYMTRSETSNSFVTNQIYSTGAAVYRFYVGMAGTVYAASTSISAISDQTLKTNIRDLETGLTEVMALKPRRFDWKNGDAENVAGFVAQEVEQVLPELVSDYKYSDTETKKSLKMGDILPTLVKAIQEQQVIIESLKARLDAANL